VLRHYGGLQALRRSENLEDRTLAEIVSAITDLRTDIAAVEKKIAGAAEGTISPETVLKMVDRAMRRSSRELDMNRELEHRFMRLLEQMGKDKAPPKEWGEEVDRLHQLMFMVRHERERNDREGAF
jgi:hypothetical protein